MENGFCYGFGFEIESSDAWSLVRTYRYLRMKIVNVVEIRIENFRAQAVICRRAYAQISHREVSDPLSPDPWSGRGHLLYDAFRLCRLDKESVIWVLMDSVI